MLVGTRNQESDPEEKVKNFFDDFTTPDDKVHRQFFPLSCQSCWLYIFLSSHHKGCAHLFSSSDACNGDAHKKSYLSEIQASSCTHSHPRFRACLARHSIPLGHFRPGQAPPTFILITSWFVPASVPRLASR